MDQTLKKTKGRLFTTQAMVKISILGVLSYIIMFFEFPFPLFPPFLKMDFSDMPAIIGGFAIGPLAGFTIELIKNLLHFITKTSTGGIGEIANLLIGGTFVVTSSFIYRKFHTKKGAFIALTVATVMMSVVGGIFNATVLIPFFAKFTGGVEPIIKMGQVLSSKIDSVPTLCLYAVVPFNMIKGVILSLSSLALYKHVSPIIKIR